MFYPPEHNKYPPSGSWLCLFDVDIKRDGYDTRDLLPEKIYFDTKSGLWKKKKNKLSKENIRDALKVYGVKSLNELHSFDMYNIQSVNARGYAVIDSNITREDQQKGVKKNLAFCLAQDDAAFCGSGSIVDEIDGKEADFTLYMLKSLEMVEIGLPEKVK